MKVSTENDNNFGYEKITILVDNIPLILEISSFYFYFVIIFVFLFK
jgi:hypothetical protein